MMHPLAIMYILLDLYALRHQRALNQCAPSTDHLHPLYIHSLGLHCTFFYLQVIKAVGSNESSTRCKLPRSQLPTSTAQSLRKATSLVT